MSGWPSDPADREPTVLGVVTAALCATASLIESERERFFLWVPVCLGAGIAAYFGLDDEPTVALAAAPLLAALGFCLILRNRPLGLVLAFAALWGAIGFLNAKIRTSWVESPVIEASTRVVQVSGWIELIEPRPAKGARLTIRLIEVEGLAADKLPLRVRLAANFDAMEIRTGDAIHLRAVLRPVPEPVAPGGFDFARKAWFDRLGGVGFAVSRPAPVSAPPPPYGLQFWAAIDGLRQDIAARIRHSLPGVEGAIATALITGERSAIPDETLTALRHSGLAHVLAISGLHMALMAGTLYWLIRAVLALFPALALCYPIKKWAAVLALAGAAFYLALSGAGIATQRAFIMMAIFFLAVLLDRPAITLRNVAIAALVILLALPESVLNVSFQMSFAAVVGLVAVYEVVTARREPIRADAPWLRVLAKAWRYFLGIALTTLVAGLATAPFAAFHFHKLAQFALLGNLVAMPLVGLVVMPMALVSLLSMPFGLEDVPLNVMEWGIDLLRQAAIFVAGLDGAVVHVAAMPTLALALLVIGGLWLCLWRQPWRSGGLIIAALGVGFAGSLPRPDVLVEREGKTLAVRSDKGLLAIPSPQRVTYSVDKWLLADGDGDSETIDRRGNAYRCDEHACIATVKGRRITFLRHPAALREACRWADIIVSQFPFWRKCPKPAAVMDKLDFRREGAHALYLERDAIRVETVSRQRGRRPWVRSKPQSPAKARRSSNRK